MTMHDELRANAGGVREVLDAFELVRLGKKPDILTAKVMERAGYIAWESGTDTERGKWVFTAKGEQFARASRRFAPRVRRVVGY